MPDIGSPFEMICGGTTGRTFGTAASFLELAAAHVPSITVTDAHAGR